MKFSSAILLLFVLQISFCKAQVLTTDDTLNIGEVMVLPSKPDGVSGYRRLKIDGDLIQNFAAESIANLLGNSTSLYIKNYGTSGLATSSFRGMGANHTEILWEGQRINSPMLGNSDFTTIPVIFMDKIDIYYGGNPEIFGNRGPGGAISFAGKVDWREKIGITYTQDIGSFSSYAEGLKLGLGTPNFQFKLKAFTRSKLNDFKYYINPGPSEESAYRLNSKEKSRGILQELYFKNKESVLSAKLWYTSSKRNLPGTIYAVQTEGNEYQDDESTRVIVRYQLYKDQFSLMANTSYLSDWLHYTNKILSVDSRNKSDRFSAQVSGKYSFTDVLVLRAGISGAATRVKSNNYDGFKLRNDISLDFSLSNTYFDRLGIIASITQGLLDGDLLPTQSSLGLDYRLNANNNYHFKGSVGRSIQLPTLNDLYWVPGGNSDLKPENSFNSELSFSMAVNAGQNSLLESELTFFRSTIKDMIAWAPVSPSVWQPQNINNVVSLGSEIYFSYNYSSGRNALKTRLSYSFTDARKTNISSANDESLDKQLIYVPRHSGSLSLKYSYKNFSSEWWSVYTGDRYITSDNSEKLDAYLLHNVSLRISVQKGLFVFSPGLRIDNVLANRYINVVGYPMPMRSYRLSVSIKFNTK